MTTTARNHDRTFGHIDLETGDAAPHVVRHYTLITRLPEGYAGAELRREWTFAISMPVRIDQALTSEDWDLVCRRLDTRVGDQLSPVEFIIFSGRLAGATSQQVQRKIGETVSEALYKCFVAYQIRHGNKAWLAPTSMQGKGNPNG